MASCVQEDDEVSLEEFDKNDPSTSNSHSSVRMSPQSQTDYELAMYGMKLMINDGVDEAKELFDAHRNESSLMHSGYSFTTVMKSLISFEDLDVAMNALRETEDLCSKKNTFNHSLLSNRTREEINDFATEDRLQREIIIADTLLYQALLTSVNQDIKSYVKAGWLLRKTWKHYEKLHKQITLLYQDEYNNDQTTSKQEKKHLSPHVARRLLGSVCFGYGCFQLGLSLIPTKVLRIIEFLGFETDRNQALSYLEFAANSTDMKAPLSMLTILWYHTYVRPFFAIDGSNFTAGIAAAEMLMSQHEDQYTNSALFMFVQARVLRMKKQTVSALTVYDKALECRNGQVELGYLCMYETAWLYLLMQQWHKALELYLVLISDTKWSKCFYQYMIALCHGCLGELSDAHRCLLAVPGCMRRKNNQIEQFVTKRSIKFKDECPSQDHMLLLMLEVMYLWRMLPTCGTDLINAMLTICNHQSDKRMLPLKCLIEGALYREIDKTDMAIQFLKEAIARFSGPKSEQHIIAFAKYELATIYVQNKETMADAKPLLAQIKDMGDFYFDQRLSVCVQNVSKEISRLSGQS